MLAVSVPKMQIEHALDFIKRGWRPIPVPEGEKAPRHPQWQNLRVTADDACDYFHENNGNVGILMGEPSGNLVDIDLDTQEAITLAPSFLPTTGSVFGRESKPCSHLSTPE